MTVVSRAEFARRAGVNRSAVTRWVQAGRIKADENGNIDLESATAMLPKTASPLPHHMARAEQITEQKGLLLQDAGATPATASNDPATQDRDEAASLRLKLARVAREEAEAQMAAMRRDEQARLLVRRSDAVFVMEDLARTLGALLERLADRGTPDVLACQGDSQAVHKVLSDAARNIRLELSRHMRERSEKQLDAVPPA